MHTIGSAGKTTVALALALALLLVAGARTAHAASAPHRPGIVLVGFRPGVPVASQRAIAAAVGAVRTAPLGGGLRLRLSQPRVLDAVRMLRRHREVRYAEPDYLMRAAATPDDTSFGSQWGPADIGAPAAWDVSTGSRVVVIGEVDSGVDYGHPDLDANVWTNPGNVAGCPAGTRGYDVLADRCDPMDDEIFFGGHGTHVAGILGAVGGNARGVAGINWATTILPVKWLDAQSRGSDSGLIAALEWLLRAKADGVNVRVVNDSATFVGTAFSQALSDEIDKLGANGILFVTAAGNTGDDNDTLAKRRYPCGYDRPTELCVAASDRDDRLPRWANYGAAAVDLAAPGDDVISTLRNDAYGPISGSSMAAPQVAGAAALILSRADLSPAELKARILDTVDPLPSMEGLIRSGGRLNVCRALPGCSAAPAAAAEARFGTATVGANAGTFGADRKCVTRYALAQDGTVTRLRILLEPGGTAGRQALRGVVYADAGGRPGALLGTTDELSYASGDDRAWYELRLPSPLALDAGSYWLGLLTGGTSGVAGFRWDAALGARTIGDDSYANGPSDPFGPLAATGDERMSLYAVFTPRAAQQSPPAATQKTSSPPPAAQADPARPQASSPPARCAETSRLGSATAHGSGGGLAFFLPGVRGGTTVDVVRESAGRTIAARRVAHFTDRRASFTWRARGIADGIYVVRLRGGGEQRALVVERRGGRFRARPAYASRTACGPVARFELSRPVFGGRHGRALGIAYRVATAGRADLRVVSGRRTLGRYAARTVPAGALVRATFPAGTARRGDVRVVLRVSVDGRTTTRTLVARRL